MNTNYNLTNYNLIIVQSQSRINFVYTQTNANITSKFS